MKIAIVGTGISGLVAAYHLAPHHEITVFEAGDHIGGHTHTHQVTSHGRDYAIDTGFIVFNDWTYPNFIALMEQLKVRFIESTMSFSVRCEKTGLEYNGTSLDALFSQRRNLLSPRFYRMLMDIFRFNREAPSLLHEEEDGLTLGDYLDREGYSQPFRDHYILPMGSAIWSQAPDGMLKFPVRNFIRFFSNHGMLSVSNRPTWRVIQGGSTSYVTPLIDQFKEAIRLNTPVESIRREGHHVLVTSPAAALEAFDGVVMACHSDQALALLSDPSPLEREILGAIPYQENEVVLHTDSRVLPKAKKAWAAWNYHIPSETSDRVAVTYNMNILQRLEANETFCVSLNHSAHIDPQKIIKRLTYHHPVFTPAGIEAQQRHGEISGISQTYYAGAYWGFGFHEDGVKSGLRVVEQIAALAQ